jgi:hypothetical protein
MSGHSRAQASERDGAAFALYPDRDEAVLRAVAAWLRVLAPAYGRGGQACLEQAARMVERHNVRMAEKRRMWRDPPERPAA